jgi:hypothetical protein
VNSSGWIHGISMDRLSHPAQPERWDPRLRQRSIFLIITNEELQNLHPAIVRLDRRLTNLEFVEFLEAEAREWIKSRDYTAILALKKTCRNRDRDRKSRQRPGLLRHIKHGFHLIQSSAWRRF